MSWGEIYNTSWWGVALDTARTVKARPDFFGSQLNLLTSEQPNLVTNGTFDTDSNWTFGTGWSMGDGKAVRTGTTSSGLTQSGSFNSGKKYKLEFTISDYVNGSIKGEFSGGGGSDVFFTSNNIGNGTFTFITETTINRNTLQFYAFNSFDGSIDNVSVQVARAELDQIEAKKCLADWIHTTALKDLNN